jgi:hypothetical protein
VSGPRSSGPARKLNASETLVTLGAAQQDRQVPVRARRDGKSPVGAGLYFSRSAKGGT